MAENGGNMKKKLRKNKEKLGGKKTGEKCRGRGEKKWLQNQK